MTADLIHGLPFERYCDLEGESATGLKDMLISPLLYRWRRDNGRPDRDALRAGRATHTAVLEPHLFGTAFAVWDGGTRRGKDWDRFRLEHEPFGRTILTETQRDAALAVAKAVRAHPVAAALLAEEGAKAEVTITWTHERTGQRCKVRIDWLCSSIVDLKSCKDPSPGLFSTQSARIGHHVQMAFYRAALAQLGVIAPAVIIAAQNQEPWDVVVYDIPEDVLMIGEQLYEAALDQVMACRRSGCWPGLAASQRLTLRLPTWAHPDWDDDDSEGVTVGEGAF